MVVLVLAVQNLFQQELHLRFKFLLYAVVILWAQQMLKFREHVLVFPWVKLLLCCVLKVLDLEEKANEAIEVWCVINVYVQNGVQCLEALGEFAHCTIMNRRSPIIILLCKYLPEPINDVLGVLIKQIENSNIEFLMSLQRVSIVEQTERELAMLDVHVFESVSILFD